MGTTPESLVGVMLVPHSVRREAFSAAYSDDLALWRGGS